MLEKPRLILLTVLTFTLILTFWYTFSKGTFTINFSKSTRLHTDNNVNNEKNANERINSLKTQHSVEEVHAGKHLLAEHDMMNESALYSTLDSIGNAQLERLIDLPDFKFKIQQESCLKGINTLIVVHTAPDNFQKRLSIRNTWANKELLHLSSIRVVFVVGTVENSDLQLKLYLENIAHADMIQGSFLDSYRNLTYKHVMALKWFLQFCTNAQLLIKVDDDVFVNTPKLLKYANNAENVFSHLKNDNNYLNVTLSLFGHSQNLVFCHIFTNSTVKRSFRSKWRVSFREYNKPQYPPYCMGYAIIYTKHAVSLLYNSAQSTRYFWIDDVYITGILTRLKKVILISLKKYFLSKDNCQKLLKHQLSLNDVEFIFSSYEIPLKNLKLLWELFPESQFDMNKTI